VELGHGFGTHLDAVGRGAVRDGVAAGRWVHDHCRRTLDRFMPTSFDCTLCSRQLPLTPSRKEHTLARIPGSDVAFSNAGHATPALGFVVGDLSPRALKRTLRTCQAA
jgi:hypothetical protein